MSEKAKTPAEPAPPVTEGEIVQGKYKIEKVLGRGGMGVVVAATHLQLRQKVAIKFLHADASNEIRERFLREARASVRLKSEHVARVIDVGELVGGEPFMVLEFLEGNDLSRVLKKRGPLPFDEAVDFLLQACEAIGEAHVAGIVHRDLKPANLFITKGVDGKPLLKVLDFGISKIASEAGEEGEETGDGDEVGLTRTKAVLGSPHYMAPEQMRSTRSVDARADIWSLGVILYQLVTQTVPFRAGSYMDLVFLVMREDPPKPSTRRAGMPPGLEAIILKCLRRQRENRFASAGQLARALAPFGGRDARRIAQRVSALEGGDLAETDVSEVASPPTETGLGGEPRLPTLAPTGPTPLMNQEAPTPPPGSSLTPSALANRPVGWSTPSMPIPTIAGAASGIVTPSLPPSSMAPPSIAADAPPPGSARLFWVGVIASVIAAAALVVILLGRGGRRSQPAETSGAAPVASAEPEAPRPPRAAPPPTPATEKPAAAPSAAPSATATATASAPPHASPRPPPKAAETAKPPAKKKNPLDMEIQ